MSSDVPKLRHVVVPPVFRQRADLGVDYGVARRVLIRLDVGGCVSRELWWWPPSASTADIPTRYRSEMALVTFCADGRTDTIARIDSGGRLSVARYRRHAERLVEFFPGLRRSLLPNPSKSTLILTPEATMQQVTSGSPSSRAPSSLPDARTRAEAAARAAGFDGVEAEHMTRTSLQDGFYAWALRGGRPVAGTLAGPAASRDAAYTLLVLRLCGEPNLGYPSPPPKNGGTLRS